ncbi:Octanoyltransferase [Halomicronema hongdechloris C2206]|uniref:Octanoyltransferase n=1 Tax=Halomicronema hongdechloris C2206 TaxID=1641165 RepID=A0A1Z3HS42_9CYAN|nr:lipoyl(octanoyl) transferase LipB [Halomicronema hongdechloris]ASC73119.1 Octanoyltransferase [Halomicronema hongdechloris C2206]
MTARVCYLHQPGLVAYAEAWAWQQQLVKRVQSSQYPGDVLLLLEHPPVYTLGKGADTSFLRFKPDQSPYAVYRVERGGEVTFHCPGQLVGYPILDLRYHRQDLHWYLRQLEQVLIDTLKHYHLVGERIPGLTGVWLDGVKVGAIGIKVSRWVTMHGFALNICPDLSGFHRIIPCGITDRPVGSLTQFCPGITVASVQSVLIDAFARVFSLTLQTVADQYR